MAGQARTIQCSWDAEASVWLATSDDVPGLATGAATLDAPIAKPNVVIPSCSTPTTCSLLIIRVTSPFAVIAERHERAPVTA